MIDIQTTAGYSFEHAGGASNDIIGIDNMNVYSGGGKAKKRSSGKKKKTTKRKPLSKKAKQMSKMRMRNVKKISQRAKKLSKRLKQRASRRVVINSLASSRPVTPETINSLSPSMKRFVSKIPRDASSSSKLTSWPDVPFTPTNKVDKKAFEDARKGLANILKQKPGKIKSKSIVKFSDYKSKPTKAKAVLKASSKKKGQTR